VGSAEREGPRVFFAGSEGPRGDVEDGTNGVVHI